MKFGDYLIGIVVVLGGAIMLFLALRLIGWNSLGTPVGISMLWAIIAVAWQVKRHQRKPHSMDIQWLAVSMAFSAPVAVVAIGLFSGQGVPSFFLVAVFAVLGYLGVRIGWSAIWDSVREERGVA